MERFGRSYSIKCFEVFNKVCLVKKTNVKIEFIIFQTLFFQKE